MDIRLLCKLFCNLWEICSNRFFLNSFHRRNWMPLLISSKGRSWLPSTASAWRRASGPSSPSVARACENVSWWPLRQGMAIWRSSIAKFIKSPRFKASQVVLTKRVGLWTWKTHVAGSSADHRMKPVELRPIQLSFRLFDFFGSTFPHFVDNTTWMVHRLPFSRFQNPPSESQVWYSGSREKWMNLLNFLNHELTCLARNLRNIRWFHFVFKYGPSSLSGLLCRWTWKPLSRSFGWWSMALQLGVETFWFPKKGQSIWGQLSTDRLRCYRFFELPRNLVDGKLDCCTVKRPTLMAMCFSTFVPWHWSSAKNSDTGPFAEFWGTVLDAFQSTTETLKGSKARWFSQLEASPGHLPCQESQKRLSQVGSRLRQDLLRFLLDRTLTAGADDPEVTVTVQSFLGHYDRTFRSSWADLSFSHCFWKKNYGKMDFYPSCQVLKCVLWSFEMWRHISKSSLGIYVPVSDLLLFQNLVLVNVNKIRPGTVLAKKSGRCSRHQDFMKHLTADLAWNSRPPM